MKKLKEPLLTDFIETEFEKNMQTLLKEYMDICQLLLSIKTGKIDLTEWLQQFDTTEPEENTKLRV
jgi:hypothetical protein